ncbi:MAG: class I SAM-dependent methyltransferase [Rhodospirillales bacterium]
MDRAGAGTWREFWNRRNRIYVNDRHLAAHCKAVAEDIVYMLLDEPGARVDGRPTVLDFGCGEALRADIVAFHAARVFLYDASGRTRARLEARFAAEPKIVVLDDAGFAALPEGAADLIFVNSVLQYLAPEEFERLLGLWWRQLKPHGRLVLADVIPPGDTPARDALALLKFARREGFFLAALGGLAATLFSDYRRLRRALGLTRYSEADMLARLDKALYVAKRRYRNLGFNQARMTFTAEPAWAANP